MLPGKLLRIRRESRLMGKTLTVQQRLRYKIKHTSKSCVPLL